MSNSAWGKVDVKFKLMAKSKVSSEKEILHNEIAELFKESRGFWQFHKGSPKENLQTWAKFVLTDYFSLRTNKNKISWLMTSIFAEAENNKGNPGLSYEALNKFVKSIIDNDNIKTNGAVDYKPELATKQDATYAIYFLMHDKEGKIKSSDSLDVVAGEILYDAAVIRRSREVDPYSSFSNPKSYGRNVLKKYRLENAAELEARNAATAATAAPAPAPAAPAPAPAPAAAAAAPAPAPAAAAAASAATAAPASAAAAPAVTAVYDASRLPVELEMKELNSQDK